MQIAEFLASHVAARAEWEAALAAIPEERYGLSRGDGDWSVKDHIAHVTWYEREMVNLLRDHVLAGSPLWDLRTDARNAAIYDLIKSRPLSEVLKDGQQTWDELWSLLQSLTDEELNDAAHFAAMPSDWAPWEVIASNTYQHYQEHAAILRNL